MASQVAKTTQRLTTAAEVREDTQMVMQPNANWGAFLTPAPLSVALMGELVFISAQSDFSISKNPPVGGFQHIKYPDSFRACLMQICNTGWHAFNEAHKNMDQIRLHTATVPDYMKAAVDILFNGSDKVVETLLPIQLESIGNISDNCVTLAESVENKFLEVIKLIEELLEASVNANKVYGDELKRVQIELEESKLREKEAEKMKEWSNKMMEDMSEEVEKAQKEYRKAMNSLPSGWKMVGMNVVEGLTSGLTAMMAGFAKRMTISVQAKPQPSTSPPHTQTHNVAQTADVRAQMKACMKSGVILQFAGGLKEYVNGAEINWKLYNQEGERAKTTLAETLFKSIYEEMKSMSEDPFCSDVLSLCKEGITICEELAKHSQSEKLDKQKTKQLIESIKKLNDNAMAFDCKSKKFSGSPALEPKPPLAFNAGNSNSGHKSASQMENENARLRIEQSRQQLNHARKAYEKNVEDMKNSEKELTDILVKMRKCELEEIDFKTTIKMLKEGLGAMTQVKTQWTKMVQFFQMISNIITVSLNGKLQGFVKTTSATKELSYNDKLFSKDLLYKQAFQASNLASLVHMISGTYTEVSNNYLMDSVSNLGELMAIDKGDKEFQAKRQKMHESCEKAQRGIRKLVEKNKKEFDEKTEARLQKIERELKAVLPADQPQETDRIREITQKEMDVSDLY